MEERGAFVIEKRSLAEQVYVFLCNAIMRGRFSYGQTISTKMLAQELGVSMMPIREALKRLELEGIVEIRPRSVCVFRTPTKKTILAALDVRELLEVYCVKSAYATVKSARLVSLRDITRDMADSVRDEPVDLKRYIDHDWRFHTALCALADNDFINKSYRELNLHLNMNYMYDIGIKPNVSQTFRDHLDLVNAMEKHDSAAVEIIQKHLTVSRQNVLSGKFFASER